MKGALATGNWGMKTNNNKQGVSQVLNRLTFMSTLSHLRRLSTPVDNTGKLIPPRKLHTTQWGYVCPTETPEGQSVGVVKNFAMMCEITKLIPSNIIRNYINDFIIHFTDLNVFDYNKLDYIKVFINGDWLGYTQDPDKLIDLFKKKREDVIFTLIHQYIGILKIIQYLYFQMVEDVFAHYLRQKVLKI